MTKAQRKTAFEAAKAFMVAVGNLRRGGTHQQVKEAQDAWHKAAEGFDVFARERILNRAMLATM